MATLDNSNPTIHSSGKQKSIAAASQDLFSTDRSPYWLAEEQGLHAFGSSDEGEEADELIDGDEIFGKSFLY